MKLSKIMAVAIAMGLSASSVFAAAGTFGSFVQIDSSWFQTENPGANQIGDFDGAFLGTYNNGDTHEITDASLLIFKNGGSDVTGTEIQWRVYETTSGPSGAFNVAGLGFGEEDPTTDPAGNTYAESGSDNQEWGANSALGEDFTSTLADGDYTLEVFYRGTTAADGDIFSNNGGSNYSATFRVVPEPATIALFGLGLGGLMVSRRRRA